MSDRTQEAEATDNELATVQTAAQAMLAALKGLCEHVRAEARPCGQPYLTALAAIAQAEKAGITTGDE